MENGSDIRCLDLGYMYIYVYIYKGSLKRQQGIEVNVKSPNFYLSISILFSISLIGWEWRIFVLKLTLKNFITGFECPARNRRKAIDFQLNSCRTKEVFLEETLLKKGFFQTIFPKLLISYCNLIPGNLYNGEYSGLYVLP
jgi:hypothetical protein